MQPRALTPLVLSLLSLVPWPQEERPANDGLGDELAAHARASMAAHGVEGLALCVVRGQEVLLCAGFGRTSAVPPREYTQETACGAFSATKVFSSLTFLSLAERGELDLDAPLESYLADLPAAWRPIPFARLLNHSSGITMIVNRPEFEELVADPNAGDREVFEIVKALPLDHAPGEFSRYRQSGYAVAAMIAGERSGLSFPDLVRARVSGPAGCTATVHSESGHGLRKVALLSAAGGYETTATDMARLFLALNAGEILDPRGLESTLQRRDYVYDGYSLGSILVSYGDVRTLGHQGGGARANIRYAPSAGVGVALFTDSQENHDLIVGLADDLLRRLLLDEALRPPATLFVVALERLTGNPLEDILAFYEAERRGPTAPADPAALERALGRVGAALLRGGRTEDGIEVLELNAAEHPRSARAFERLGAAYHGQGDEASARRNYRRALDLDPESATARAGLEQISPGPEPRGR